MKYPGGFKKLGNSSINYSNRGMSFEADINITNEYYRSIDKAIIYKKPTPITINKVDYKSRDDAKITEAYFNTPSTTDYNGIYKGKYIDFEAKETKLNYFPLANIHEHQIKHLKKIVEHGGIGFILVDFTKLGEIYLLTCDKLLEFINNNDRKSIPVEYFREFGYLIKPKFNPRIDYLSIIDLIYYGG